MCTYPHISIIYIYMYTNIYIYMPINILLYLLHPRSVRGHACCRNLRRPIAAQSAIVKTWLWRGRRNMKTMVMSCA